MWELNKIIFTKCLEQCTHSISIQCSSYYYQVPYGTLNPELEIKLEIQLINKILDNVVNIDYPRPVLIKNLTRVMCSVLELVKLSSLPCHLWWILTGLVRWNKETSLAHTVFTHKVGGCFSMCQKTNICLTDLLCQEPKMPLPYRTLSAFMWIQSTDGYVICAAVSWSNNIKVCIWNKELTVNYQPQVSDFNIQYFLPFIFIIF